MAFGALRSAAAPPAAVASLSDFDSETRVTPSMLRRRAISSATFGLARVQPVMVIAGAGIAPRSEAAAAARAGSRGVAVEDWRS